MKDRLVKSRKLKQKLHEDQEKAKMGWPYVPRMWQVDIIFKAPDGRRPKWHGFVNTFGQVEAARKGWSVALDTFEDVALEKCKFEAYVVNVTGRVK